MLGLAFQDGGRGGQLQPTMHKVPQPSAETLFNPDERGFKAICSDFEKKDTFVGLNSGLFAKKARRGGIPSLVIVTADDANSPDERVHRTQIGSGSLQCRDLATIGLNGVLYMVAMVVVFWTVWLQKHTLAGVECWRNNFTGCQGIFDPSSSDSEKADKLQPLPRGGLIAARRAALEGASRKAFRITGSKCFTDPINPRVTYVVTFQTSHTGWNSKETCHAKLS